MEKTEYELERDRRVAENKRKMEELGLSDAAAAMVSTKPAAEKRQKRPKAAAVPTELLERRVSGRERKEVNYAEMEARIGREPKAPVDYTERIKCITLDQERAEQLRKELAEKRGETSKSGGSNKSKSGGGKTRGPVDSGKGVRIQGGKVYDSTHGVCCHWCRQKTLEDHVTCTNPACGNGRRMPLSFCAKCLRNRHGEDFAAAEASDSWWCPSCRGSCGPGCVICCNCGPCRKKAGLEPTHQVAKLARDAGYDNVHDYLVHLVTGDSADKIAERKLKFPWGRWLKKGGEDEQEEEQEQEQQGAGRSSGVSEQTDDACRAGGCSADAAGGHTHGRSRKAAARQGGSSSNNSPADEADEEAAQDQGAAEPGVQKSSKPPTGRKRAPPKKAAPKAAAGKKGSKKAAAAAAAVEAEQQQQQAEEEQEQQDEQQQQEPEEEDADVPMLSSQDTTLSRKQRMMQRLGLAPVTVMAK